MATRDDSGYKSIPLGEKALGGIIIGLLNFNAGCLEWQARAEKAESMSELTL